jgi:Zn-dependent protease
MATTSPPSVFNERCDRCAQQLSPGVLACPQCHSLVHGEELERLSVSAKSLEEAGQLQEAHDEWLRALQLLPPDSLQAEWVRGYVYKLELTSKNAPPKKNYEWAKKLGPLGPVLVVLAKSKALFSLFRLKFLFSLGAFLGFYWVTFGVRFGIGFAVLILIHEMGHYIDIKRRGLSADMPIFLPGFGAYVRWQATGVSKETRAAVSLAGPLAGSLAAVVCAISWWKTGDPLWAALAWSGAWLNAMNLIPVWVLDGGQATLALGKTERWILLTASLALWLVLHESVFVLVAGGMIWRLFTKDLAPNPSRLIATYYTAVLASLGIVMSLMPHKEFGNW